MKCLKENLVDLCFMLSIPILGILYRVLNNYDERVHILVTSLDQQIPLIKIFVIPYLGWYVFIFFTLCYFCFKDKDTYYQVIISYNICILTCCLIYIVFQTTVPRPQLVGNDFLTIILAFLYSIDNPFNCFPSIHCSTSFLMVSAIYKSSIRNNLNRFIITTLAILIIFSTLFIKQHVILDVISAILLADLIYKSISSLGVAREFYYGFLNRYKFLISKNNKV